MSFTRVKNSPSTYKILLVALPFFFFSCKQLDEENEVQRFGSSGAVSEIVVLSSSYLLDSTNKSEIKRSFSPVVESLPVAERFFKVYFSHESIFTEYFKNHFNMVVLVTDRMIRESKRYPFMIPSITKKWSELPEVGTELNAKDVWSINQSVLYIYVKNKGTCLNYLKSNRSEHIHSFLLDQESKFKKRELSKTTKPGFEKKLMKEKGFGIPLPAGYRVALRDSTFIWLRKNIPDLDYGIFIYEQPYESLDQAEYGRIIYERDAAIKDRIQSEREKSFMKTEAIVKPTFRRTRLNGQYTVETRGWWKMENDFMGGPFISYTIIDTTINKVVTLEGNVYGPGEDKWKHIRTLELILQNYSHSAND
jgi:hypothetical protein